MARRRLAQASSPPTEEPPRPLVWSVQDAAWQLGLSERQVWYQIERGHLRALKNGGRTVIADAELQRYVAQLPEREVG